ncbi:Hypothetical predicted protein [Olea europaea subsp. europaea]|uniref:Uncharacterized protein n=1 Tax=Olea europaea subsp. europaea TaxID=158383 RepID=A0A8S0UI82_OLEEU|nr:Hypothetical predicted protein [Olea europaea subsp. europaea]
MLRMNIISRRNIRLPNLRRALSSSGRNLENSTDSLNNLKNSQNVPLPPAVHHQNHHPSPLSSSSALLSKTSILTALSATLLVVSYTLIPAQDDTVSGSSNRKSYLLYKEIENAIEKSNESFNKILNRMKQTGTAASVLWQSLRSVMSSANHEVRAGFELRVAALLADIVAASENRRAAIVEAGGGKWPRNGTQSESARVLAYLIADVNEAVFARPDAVRNLLRFIFSAQPRRIKNFICGYTAFLFEQQSRRSSFDVSDSLKGRSMLVAAIMDVVTSNCDSVEKLSVKPSLPKNAEMRDIAAAIEVIEDGGMHWNEQHGDEDDDNGDQGMKGIGIKVLGGTTVLGLSRTSGFVEMEHSDAHHSRTMKSVPKNLLFNKIKVNFPAQANLSSAGVPGLWEDLHSEHVAVPFAVWALANWAMASELNRSHIQELDRDGFAVMSALMAPKRSVKWHGSLVARLLLEHRNLPLNDSVSDWSSSLLSIISHASKTQDIPSAQVALSALLVSIERCPKSREVLMNKGLHLTRESAKQTLKHKPVQEMLAKAS